MPYSCLLTPFPLRHQARKPEAPVRSSVSLKPTAPVRDRVVPDRATPPTRTDSPDRAGRKKVLGLVQLELMEISLSSESYYLLVIAAYTLAFRSLVSFTICVMSTPITTPAHSVPTTPPVPQARGPCAELGVVQADSACARSSGPGPTNPTHTDQQFSHSWIRWFRGELHVHSL